MPSEQATAAAGELVTLIQDKPEIAHAEKAELLGKMEQWDAMVDVATKQAVAKIVAKKDAEKDRLRTYGIELLQLKFEEYSESKYFATWHDGIELAIWQAAASGDTSALKIVELAKLLGVWLEWIDGEDGPTPVPLAEWRARQGGAG